MYDQLVSLISSVGFPIAASIYLLTRLDKKIDGLNKSLCGLREDIAAVIKHQKR